MVIGSGRFLSSAPTMGPTIGYLEWCNNHMSYILSHKVLPYAKHTYILFYFLTLKTFS